MNNPYDLHSWSKQCREEALREARMRDLLLSTRSSGGAHLSGARAARLWSSMFSLLGRTELVEQSVIVRHV
jgi:hypothetical protein